MATLPGRPSIGYDYVVVGAGSAGCVLAARLSEDRAARVLLLEAGERDDTDLVRIPLAFPQLFKSRWDWGYETVEQKQLAGRRAYWPRMKGLGGCSAMNAMIYVRGNAADYDGWRDAHGATGWGYAEVLPYFLRAEANVRGASPYHGGSGPLRVEDRRWTHELTTAWVDAAVASGLRRTEDFNGAEQDGVGLYQVTQRYGRRWSAADAYLRPALGRPNLDVVTGAHASRVLVERGRAVGVAYRVAGVEHVARADAEVVLAGGTIGSPQLLLLSGIGPAGHLREVGVDVVAHLPGVGDNLHDHPATPMVWHTRGTTDLKDFDSPARVLQWLLTRRGPLVSNVGEGGGFFRTRAGLPAPDVQVHVAPTTFVDHGLAEPPPGGGFTAGVTLVDVASRGRLRLHSADPRWRPDLDPDYYAEPRDLDAVVAGCRRMLVVAREAPLARFLDRPYVPSSTDALSDGELREHVRRHTGTLYHPVGTCAMGAGEDAVVDPDLRVRGVEALRVVDASVMPVVPRGNTHAPTVMVAEKAADLILGRPPLPPSSIGLAAACG